MVSKLNPTNPDHILYDGGMIQIAILGGIRLEGLDRMRVTLKLKVEEQSIRHNLDLYNDNQVEKLVRKTAERLEIGTSITAGILMDLTDQLEQYRLTEIEKENQQTHNRKILTKQETKAAEHYLKAPNLIQRTMQDIGKTGVIGEEQNRLLMYLIFTSRKRQNPLHIISLGSSGIGKTHLQEKVSALIPQEDKIEITTLSENALYYFGQTQLQNKLILIEDLDGAENVLYPLRELQSKKHITKTIVHKDNKGQTKTITLKVQGPVSVAGCTTKETLYQDNANRSFLINIDQSKEQDEKIMAYQRKQSAGKIDHATEHQTKTLLQNTQRILQPITVRNPYAQQLAIPSEVFKPRRTNTHYLAFIEAITFYHQWQRHRQYDKDTGEEYIETTLEDIAEANKLMKTILLQKSDELTIPCRNYFERLKEIYPEQDKNTFTTIDTIIRLRLKETTIRRYHKQLINVGLLHRDKDKKQKTYHYYIPDHSDYHHLKNQINTILDKKLEELQKTTTRQPNTTPKMAAQPNIKPKA